MNTLPRLTVPTAACRMTLLSLFLAAASAPVLAQATWDNRTALIGAAGNTNVGFAHNGSRFLMVTSSPATYWKSAAGTANWTSSSIIFPTTGVTGLSIAQGAGATLVTGSKNVLMRTTVADPVTASWASQRPVVRPDASNPGLNRVRFLNNQFVISTQSYNDATTVANSYTEAITSADGITWTSRKFTYASLANTTLNLRDAAFKPGAGAGTGTHVFATGTNTVLVANEALNSASRVNFSASPSDTAFIVTYGSGVFVVITSNGKIFTSATGTTGTWTLRTTPVTTPVWSDVFHDGTTFVAVGDTVTGSSPARPAIIQSADGITWTEATTVPATSSSLSSVFRGDGLWLAGGGTRALFTSGSSSVTAPAFTAQPANVSDSVGGTITLTATVTGSPEPTLQWFRNDGSPVALVDDARIFGATTSTLTITDTTYADAKSYYLAATNAAGTTNSTVATVALDFTAGGAVLTPYNITNSLGGDLIPGASPATALIGGASGRFTVGTGYSPLTGSLISTYSAVYLGGISPDGTKAILNGQPIGGGSTQPFVYDLVANTGALLPAPALPLGPISSYTFFNGIAIANNGDAVGQFLGQDGVTRGFHYAAAASTYTLLGNVPNTNNDAATNPGDISSDGTTVCGYERISTFDGPFLWTTTGGFTLLPQPANGSSPNGDIRAISPNGRYTVGYGTVAGSFGSGSTAMRWDRGSPASSPVGFALPRRLTDIFGDGRTVNDDGTVGGNVRPDSINNRAAVWLPSGALVMLADYVLAQHGLALPGFTLAQVTSISSDRRTFAGTGRLADSSVQGWILTLPAPLDISATPEIVLCQSTTEHLNGSTVSVGTAGIGSPSYVQTPMRVLSLGGVPLTGITATIGGANASDFFYVPNGGNPGDLLPTSLGINEGAMFDLRFAPVAGTTGTRTATLTITSNDSDESSYVLNLQGTAVTPTTQTITFNQPPDRLTTDAPFALSATASSGFTVSFVLISGPVTLFGNTLTLTGASGTVTVEARQTGNATVLAATPVQRSFAVNPPAQSTLETFLANAGVPANQRGANDDPDKDGLSNLIEFALGLAPNTFDAAAAPKPVQTTTHLTYTYRRAQAGVTYLVQASPDLSAGSWSATGVDQGTQAQDGTTTARIPLGTGSRFLRLSVTLNP